MSDSDDGFDEEAVREELREKYESEQEDREATARMSDLLLQGATMTNDHCDRCGSPLFRQDGQTFCPNCQHADQQAASEGAQQNGGQQQGQTAGGQQRQDQTAAGEQPQGSDQQAQGRDGQPERTQDVRDARDDATQTDPSTRDLPEHAPTASASGPAGDALESTIAALARRAASADDPRTAREYLEAAREAAEALAALR
jgi:UPF0148 protein